MTGKQQDLADRIRTALEDEPSTRTVSMFGGLSFMVHEKMVVAAQRDGALLVRIDPADHARLLARPGVSQAEMGTGRPMGPGWISVDPRAITDDEQLGWWIEVAMEFNAAVRSGG